MFRTYNNTAFSNNGHIDPAIKIKGGSILFVLKENVNLRVFQNKTTCCKNLSLKMKAHMVVFILFAEI